MDYVRFDKKNLFVCLQCFAQELCQAEPSVGGSDFEQVSVTVEIDVHRLGYGRFQGMFATQSMQPAPVVNLAVVNGVDLIPI
jgi:hypothetical protein